MLSSAAGTFPCSTKFAKFFHGHASAIHTECCRRTCRPRDKFTFTEMTPAMPRHALEKQLVSQFRLTPPDLGVRCRSRRNVKLRGSSPPHHFSLFLWALAGLLPARLVHDLLGFHHESHLH